MPRSFVRSSAALTVAAAIWTAGCSTHAPVGGPSRPDHQHFPPPHITERGTEVGMASWYGPGFDGRPTSNGERFNRHDLTAAHRTLPFGTIVEVTDRQTGRSVRVRINDRGPYVQGRVLDLSYGAAKKLGILGRGVVPVEIRVVGGSGAASHFPSVDFGVQVGAFRHRNEAEAMARRLRQGGDPTYVVAPDADSAHYRVRLGPFRQRSLALRAAASLSHAGYDTMVVEETSRAGHADRR